MYVWWVVNLLIFICFYNFEKCMTRKIKYIVGMIWWQFRKKKVKRRLFERIREDY